MALHLIQQPDGLFCTFDPATASFHGTGMDRDDVADAVTEAMDGSDRDSVAARTDYLTEGAETDRLRWAAARERVCQVHGPDAAEWMRALDRQAFIDAFNNATPAQVEAAISTLSPEGQAWARAFEAKGTPR